MNLSLFPILIAAFVVQNCDANCQQARELEATCGTYCFSAVKPILEHTRVLQSKITSLEAGETAKTQQRLENIERLLDNSIDGAQMAPFERIGSKYYYIEHELNLNWFAAAHKCTQWGGHLLQLHNEYELRQLSAKLKYRMYWTDINDLASEGEFISLTSGLKAPFLKWYADGEPNNSGSTEHCVQLREVAKDYTMNDDSCNQKYPFICEKEFA